MFILPLLIIPLLIWPGLWLWLCGGYPFTCWFCYSSWPRHGLRRLRYFVPIQDLLELSPYCVTSWSENIPKHLNELSIGILCINILNRLQWLWYYTLIFKCTTFFPWVIMHEAADLTEEFTSSNQAKVSWQVKLSNRALQRTNRRRRQCKRH